jgi:hypothetical protein
MILNPCQIENINEATAQAAALVTICLSHRRSAALLAHVFAARKCLVDIHDGGHWASFLFIGGCGCFRQKNQARILFRA